MSSDDTGTDGLTRRDFVRSGALAAGAGLMMGNPTLWAQEAAETKGNGDELAVAIIGVGSQGGNLLNRCLKIPGIRFVAVCDIWPYWLSRYQKLLKRYDQSVTTYVDYREMLAKEKNIDAVIIATPDFRHAEQTIACLEAGKQVYCEKEMSNTIEGCASMVRAARKAGKLLQIGHQRRSNPRYWHAIKLIEKDKILGRITHCYAQWNRAALLERGWPKKHELDTATLISHGFDTMHQHRNWRWYKKYSGGPMADLGSHQVDVFNWVLKGGPRSVMASGGVDYYKSEWYDNVLAIYEYETPAGLVRGSYQVLNTTSHGGFYEVFMGDEGSIIISEDSRKGGFFREVRAKRREWEAESETTEKDGREMFELKIGETLAPDGSKDPEGQRLLEELKKPEHQLHLENFFNAVRTGTPLSCRPEIGFETAVSVLRANDAVEAGKRLTFEPKDFEVT
ncbi:MAG: Gfo/Idh/MocA family oxidoreductase [Planctomycetes bacterium]|nr:Gfo/Idh/MocA family oxidoreductase [Planctomycetota bacterium]